MFDYGTAENMKVYNSSTPPQYDLTAFPQSIPIGAEFLLLLLMCGSNSHFLRAILRRYG